MKMKGVVIRWARGYPSIHRRYRRGWISSCEGVLQNR